MPNYKVVYGEKVEELDKADLRKKLERNIKFLKKLDPTFNMSEEEINAQLSDANFDTYYKAKAMKMKRDRSRAEVIGREQGSTFFTRSYNYMRKLDMESDQPTFELNKDMDQLMLGTGDDAQKFRQEKIIEYMNKWNAINPDALNLDTKSIADIVNYVTENQEIIFTGPTGYAIVDPNLLSGAGIKINPYTQEQLGLIGEKGVSLGGIGQRITEFAESEYFFTMPHGVLKRLGENADTRVIDKMLESLGSQNVGPGFEIEPGDTMSQDDITYVFNGFSKMQTLHAIGKSPSTIYVEPALKEVTEKDITIAARSFSQAKEELEKAYNEMQRLDDGTEIFKSDRYLAMKAEMEKSLKTMAQLSQDVNQNAQLGEDLKAQLGQLRQDSLDFPKYAQTNNYVVSDDLAKWSNSVNEVSTVLSGTNQLFNTAMKKWNELESKDPRTIANVRRQSVEKAGTYFEKNEAVVHNDKRISWDRVTNEKSFVEIGSYAGALAALKHFKKNLESTDVNYKKNSEDFKAMYRQLSESITALEGHTAKADEQLWKDQMALLEGSVGTYLNGKNERLTSYGTNDRSVRRYEDSLAMLNLANQVKNMVPPEKEAKGGDYLTTAATALQELRDEMNNLADAKKDSKEFKRLQDQLNYATNMLLPPDGDGTITKLSRREVGRLMASLRNPAMAYYMSKCDKGLYGTRPDKLDLALRVARLEAQSGSAKYMAHAKDEVSEFQMYEEVVGSKIAKAMLERDLKSGDPEAIKNAKAHFEDSAKFMNNATTIIGRRFFSKAFGNRMSDMKAFSKKSAADLLKLYDKQIPKIAQNRPVDDYMKKVAQAEKNSHDKVWENFKFSREDKDALKVANTGLSVSRSALESLALSLMLNDGYKEEDVLNPEKFKEKKEEYVKRTLNLVTSGDKKAIKAAYKGGLEKLMQCTQHRLMNTANLDAQSIVSENAQLIEAEGYFIKDISQEIGRKGALADLFDIPERDELHPITEEEKLKLIEQQKQENELYLLKADTINKIGAAIADTRKNLQKAYHTNPGSFDDMSISIVPGLMTAEALNRQFKTIKQRAINNNISFLEAANNGSNYGQIYVADNEILNMGIGSLANLHQKLNKETDAITKYLDKDPLIGDAFINQYLNGELSKVDFKLSGNEEDVFIDKEAYHNVMKKAIRENVKAKEAEQAEKELIPENKQKNVQQGGLGMQK